MKNWVKKNIKILNIFLYICAGAGLLLILYPVYTNLITSKRGSQELTAWEEQQETFFEEKEGEGTTKAEVATEVEEAEETVVKEDEAKDSSTVSENSTGITEDSKAVDLVEDPAMAIDSLNSELSIHEGLTAEDFFPLKMTIPKIELEWIS